jgi:proteasome lid subunit RPN8/RPN11
MPKLMFPILLKTPAGREQPEPLPSLYYEVAANGVFQVREAKTHRAVTRATAAVPGLLAERESVDLYFPRLPAALIENVLAFFDTVHRQWHGEAIVILFYHPERERFEVGVPPQTIGFYRDAYGRSRTDHHLDYGNVERPSGAIRLGTIHSHGNLPAYASETDCEDEQYGDGLHIVFGSLDREPISRSATFVANGRRFPLDPDEVLERADIPAWAASASWLERVSYVESSVAHGWAAVPTALYPATTALYPATTPQPEPVEQLLERLGKDENEH